MRIDEDGFIYINGEKLQESYGKEVMRDPGLAKDGRIISASMSSFFASSPTARFVPPVGLKKAAFT